MEYNHYLSDDNQSKEDLLEQDDYFIHKELNEKQPIENKDLSKDSQINQIIQDECFEKAFNQIFDPKSKDIEYENEEDFSPPVMNDYPNEIKDIGPCQEEKTIFVFFNFF